MPMQWRARDAERIARWHDDKSAAIMDAVVLIRDGQGDGTVEWRIATRPEVSTSATWEARERAAETPPMRPPLSLTRDAT